MFIALGTWTGTAEAGPLDFQLAPLGALHRTHHAPHASWETDRPLLLSLSASLPAHVPPTIPTMPASRMQLEYPRMGSFPGSQPVLPSGVHGRALASTASMDTDSSPLSEL
jgi:hypothetical protein